MQYSVLRARRADGVNFCTVTDESTRYAVLSAAQRADDVNLCTVTDEATHYSVLSAARAESG
jgi:hypothetical protein